ncbi:hypothetical protein Gotri_011464 [Gossypium trilobum]|uniref:Yippee domain-containing protein n=1 Tax=Gossypium trilobum TaxID=34281 RepID=A0A7J9EVG5_9ROSI|nr:hypothetical protein [Gossypium trilobum]
MGKVFVVELDGRSYRCGFCKTHLALPDDLVSREAAYEKSQKYKEGKFVLERGRIVDEIDFSSEVYIDTRPSMSDSEDA